MFQTASVIDWAGIRTRKPARRPKPVQKMYNDRR